MLQRLTSKHAIWDFGLVKAGTSHLRVIQLSPSNLYLEYIEKNILGVYINPVNLDAGYQDRKLVFFSHKKKRD